MRFILIPISPISHLYQKLYRHWYLNTGWHFHSEHTNFIRRKSLEPQESLETKSQIIKILDGYCAYSTFKVPYSENIYNSTTIGNVSRVKLAVYHVNLTGNLTDYTAVHTGTRGRPEWGFKKPDFLSKISVLINKNRIFCFLIRFLINWNRNFER